MAVRFVKDPEAILDYSVDWSNWLVSGDTLANTVFIADPGLTVFSENFTSTIATGWLMGGIPGQTYNVVCHITTAEGRQDDRTFQIVVKET